jgi:polygalacturonase
MAQEIAASVQPPSFPDSVFHLLTYEAHADGIHDDLPAFKAAINACAAAGGGQVLVPAGEYLLMGPIHLKSNINLHLAKGATVRFSTKPEDYLPVVYTRWEGAELMNFSPLIYAFEQENIAVTGEGVFDGQASDDNWWKWKRQSNFPVPHPDSGTTTSRDLLIEMNRSEVPIQDRVFGAGHHLRPNFIQPYRCENVWIQGVTFRNSPMWIMHPVQCQNVLIEDVNVISHGPNSDGCDPESCRDVIIRNCYFDTGDDCIALKSGRNQDGRRIGAPIERVLVQHCTMKDGHGGIVIGSEVSGGARYIFGEDCDMDSPNLDRAIRVKTNRSRGGTIEHLYFRNIRVGTVREAVVKVNMRYTLDDTISVFMPQIHDIVVENVTATASKYGVQIIGYSDEQPVRGVTIRNSRFTNVTDGNVFEHATDLKFDSLYVNGELVPTP